MGEQSLNSRQWQHAPDILTIEDVAFLLNVGTSTVYRKSKSGEYPRMQGYPVRFDKDALRSALAPRSLKTEENQNVFSGMGSKRKELKLCR